MTRWQGKIGLLGYGLFLSALIGVIGFIYIIVVEQLTALLWQHLQAWHQWALWVQAPGPVHLCGYWHGKAVQ